MRFYRIAKNEYEVWDGPRHIGFLRKFPKGGWWYNSQPNIAVNQQQVGKTLHEARQTIANFGVVYLIHFDRPLKHAKHYLGWAQNLHLRLQHHENGTGARILQVVKAEGIGWKLVRTWIGNRALEKRLKGHSSCRYCPECNAHAIS